MANTVARAIAIRNAVKARQAKQEGQSEAPKAPRKKGFDLDLIISGEASRSTLKRFVASMEGRDEGTMSVDETRALDMAEQMLAPKVQDRTPFQAVVNFDAIESKQDKNDQPYFVMKGCEIQTPAGETVKRTVMAFGSAHARVKDLVLSGQELVLDVQFAGPVLKVLEEAPMDVVAL